MSEFQIYLGCILLFCWWIAGVVARWEYAEIRRDIDRQQMGETNE